MIQTQGAVIQPFPVGQQITNGTADVAKYNVFAITVGEEGANSVGNYRSTYLFSRGCSPSNYGAVLENASYKYWCWYQISLSGNTFSAIGGRYFSRSDGVRHSSAPIKAVYGIC